MSPSQVIINLVAEHYGIDRTDILERTHCRRIAYPRQIAMLICRRVLRWSWPRLGTAFGGKHHTTILYGCKAASARAAANPALAAEVLALTEKARAALDERSRALRALSERSAA